MKIPPGIPRVAVIGSGPSGLYTVAALVASGQPLHVDVIDRLPTPYGLVRYGVAPDHAKMKLVTRVLAKPFAQGNVRFVGNVEVGRDLAHGELVASYDAVVYASGTERDRRLGIAGEDRAGVLGSAEFVRWYNGHPDAATAELSLDMEQVAVVGAGNVALDVARVLGRTVSELRATDVPARVLAALDRSAVREIHILIRRTLYVHKVDDRRVSDRHILHQLRRGLCQLLVGLHGIGGRRGVLHQRGCGLHLAQQHLARTR